MRRVRSVVAIIVSGKLQERNTCIWRATFSLSGVQFGRSVKSSSASGLVGVVPFVPSSCSTALAFPFMWSFEISGFAVFVLCMCESVVWWDGKV